jgi:hypothetical protein
MQGHWGYTKSRRGIRVRIRAPEREKKRTKKVIFGRISVAFGRPAGTPRPSWHACPAATRERSNEIDSWLFLFFFDRGKDHVQVNGSIWRSIAWSAGYKGQLARWVVLRRLHSGYSSISVELDRYHAQINVDFAGINMHWFSYYYHASLKTIRIVGMIKRKSTWHEIFFLVW